jgi:hypothetical protein
MKRAIIILAAILTILSIFWSSGAMAEEVEVNFPGVLYGAMGSKKIGLKTICIDGYKYLIVVTYQGASVTQVFELSPDKKAALPARCGK